MQSPGSCIRCACPLEVASESGLCPTCLRAVDTVVSIPKRPPTGLLPVPLDSDAPTPYATPTFAPRLPDASTATGRPGEATPVFAAPPVATVPLPPAPAGYDLLRYLGGGGMGDVFLAREHITERTVAMKFLRAAGNPSALERFLLEVRALAALDHPNIVRVLATDFLRADPYFTMELADCGSLGAWVEEHGPLAPADAGRLLATVARAVAAAHAAGILHRDLKPSNILLSRRDNRKFETRNSKLETNPTQNQSPSLETDKKTEGASPSIADSGSSIVSDFQPKVSDFGLAKRLDQDDGLTVGSGPLGTPSFMPPEQISRRNGQIGPPSDVYGLGATLYHVLTGRPPFGPGLQLDVVQQVLSDPPPRPRAIRPSIPADLDGIVVKCLEKDPAARYASADELADDLDRFLAGQQTAARPLTRWRRVRRWVGRNRKRLARAGAVVLLAAGLVATGLAIPPRPKPPVDPPDPVAEIQKELAAGRPVTLVGETGLPRWHDWRLAAATLGASPTKDRACYFQTFEFSLLDIAPDPGIDRYRVTAEICHLIAEPRRQGEQRSPGRVGLYFGADSQPAADGRIVTTLFLVIFSDEVPQPIAGQAQEKPGVEVKTAVITPARLPGPAVVGIGKRPFTPAVTSRRPWPGDWRKIAVDITPDSVAVHWWEDPKKAPTTVLLRTARPPAHAPPAPALTGDQTRAWYAGMNENIRKLVPEGGPVARPWHPRMPVGIYANNSWVAFRNVVIEPL